MGRVQSYLLLVVIGALLLVSTVNAQHGNQGTGEDSGGEEQQRQIRDSENHQSNQKRGGSEENNDDYQSQNQQQKGYEELLSLIEFELYEMSPVMFTMYGEAFVDSINDLLKGQMVNSSVVGVLVSELSDEPSTMVATLILSYFNDTILNLLGDIESYLASYLYKNRENMTLYATRVASVHSQKVTTLLSDSDSNRRGWAFIVGNSPANSVESKSMEGTVKYAKVDFTLGHTHSFGYNSGKRSLKTQRDATTTAKEVAEVDDDFIEWNKFKIFHMRNADMASDGTEGWNSVTWNERSVQESAEDAWSKRNNAKMSVGAIVGTVIGVLVVAVISAVGVATYALHKRKKKLEQAQALSLDRGEPQVLDGMDEQTALV